jgi:hypothetical protein
MKWKCNLYFVAAVFCSSVCADSTPADEAATTPSVKSGSAILIGPDPNSRSALFELLKDEQVQQQLELNEREISAVIEIGEKYKEEMRSYLDSIRLSGKQVDQKEYRQIQAVRKEAAENAIEEILTGPEISRLRQIAFRIEVSRIGLSAALVLGRLGTEVRIYDNQKHSVFERGSLIESHARQEIDEIRQRAEADILSTLTPEQRRWAKDALGEYFYYEPLDQSNVVRERSKVFTEGQP